MSQKQAYPGLVVAIPPTLQLFAVCSSIGTQPALRLPSMAPHVQDYRRLNVYIRCSCCRQHNTNHCIPARVNPITVALLLPFCAHVATVSTLSRGHRPSSLCGTRVHRKVLVHPDLDSIWPPKDTKNVEVNAQDAKVVQGEEGRSECSILLCMMYMAPRWWGRRRNVVQVPRGFACPPQRMAHGYRRLHVWSTDLSQPVCVRFRPLAHKRVHWDGLFSILLNCTPYVDSTGCAKIPQTANSTPE